MGDLIPFRKRTRKKWTRAEDYGQRRAPRLPGDRRWLLGGWTPWIVLIAALAVWQFGFAERSAPRPPGPAPVASK